PSSRCNQRINVLRRHASLTRIHGGRTKPTTLCDTKSIRSVRSFNRHEQHKFETISLPGKRKLIHNNRSLYGFSQKSHKYPPTPRSQTIVFEPSYSLSPRIEEKTSKCKCSVTHCFRLSPQRMEMDAPYFFGKEKYGNNVDAGSKGTYLQLKTYSNAFHSNITGQVSIPQISSTDGQKDMKEGECIAQLPLITIDDHGNENLRKIQHVSADEESQEMGKPGADESVLTTSCLPNTHVIHRIPSVKKPPSMDSSLSKSICFSSLKKLENNVLKSLKFRMRAEMLDSRSFRSAESERSDEQSLRSLRKTASSYKREKMPVSVGIITVVLFIAGGAILFAVWEDWNLFDGAYYSFITLSTIGFGDIVPGQSLGEGSQEKLIVCALYLLFGMALIAMCFKLMQDDVVQKARWLGRKIGILGKASTRTILKEESSSSESDLDEDVVLEEDEEDNERVRVF
ncbi:unnamed protein product, partial [Dracunculus medinensis]|uniref:Ion_trans_2 domain-containing protein n=1 Tax=Dracunculus medinensis TaxID=318479 RepID=A0A0N4UG84_DRAME